MDKSACIKFAGSLLGTWKPVPWQGAHTYTSYDEDNCAILQFRGPKEEFDREILDLAVAVHGQLVPKAQYLGTVPEQPWVLIWYMERMPGDPYLFHASSPAPEQVLAAVADLAR
nr:hypothetical protein CFP56_01127 [Quercus suber]